MKKPAAPDEPRRARLAAALRANLKRRKASQDGPASVATENDRENAPPPDDE